MREALASLPWVEQGSIDVNVTTQKVKFDVKGKGQFDLKAAKDALAKQGFNDVRFVKGPT